MTHPFTTSTWDKMTAFSGRVAKEADVTAGLAVYALSDTQNGQVLDLVLAESHDTEEGETLEVLGLLLPNGETVVAFRDDVDEVDATDPFWVALVEAFDPEGDDA